MERRRKRRKTDRRSIRRKRKKDLRLPILACLFLTLILIFSLFLNKNGKIPYISEIKTAAGREELDPALVAAIIRQESNFDPEAKSRVGAQGLMQIMPETWQHIAEMKGGEAPDNPYNIKDNLNYGCYYFSYLMDRFDGEIATALAAYNAGPTVTSKWLKDPEYSRDNKSLYNIPYDETRNYVKKVLAYYEEYKGKI